MKTCHFCGNKNFKSVKVKYTYNHNDKFLMVEDVPCEQCEYCGEQYFEGSVLKKIENEFNMIHSKKKKVERELIMPVEQFIEIQSAN
jgi:YgiT-type zinc finger domain-containing protein